MLRVILDITELSESYSSIHQSSRMPSRHQVIPIVENLAENEQNIPDMARKSNLRQSRRQDRSSSKKSMS